MSDAHAFLQNLALVFCVAAVTTVVFHRLRQPVVFGYLLAGMIVGPYLPIPLVADEATVHTLSELGVVLLMFSLGLEFNLRRVAKVASTSGLSALAETSVMTGLGFIAAQALGWTAIESVFAGGMVAISSTTIVAKAFAENRVTGRVTETVFGILIVEDLIAILLIAVLTAVAAGGGLSPSALAMTSVRLATFLIALIGVGLLTLPRLMRAVMRAGSREMTLVASVGVCFGGALLARAFGYSVALGAFIAGSLVSESGEGETIAAIVEPVRDLFLAIFFVSVGMLIDPASLAEHWGAVLTLVVVVIVGKVVAVTLGAFLTGNGLRTSVQAGMSLAQIGEFSFIIAAVGTASGAIRPFLYPVAIAVSAATTLSTPWLIRAAGPAASFVDRKLPHSVQTFVALYGSWIERLRQDPAGAGGRARSRRLVRLLIASASLLAIMVTGFAAERRQLTTLLEARVGLSEPVARLVLVGFVVALAIPLLAGLVRMSWLLSVSLAVRAIPLPGSKTVDFARAPRTALVVALQIGILLAILAPMAAITQPFLRGVPTIAALLIAVASLGIAFVRASRELQGHARAGAEVILAALDQQRARNPSAEDVARTIESMSGVLPGLGEPIPVAVATDSRAVGHTLAELNLRALTGATVLGISRDTGPERHTIVPSGSERLSAGDVLIIGGPRDAVAAARDIVMLVADAPDKANTGDVTTGV